MLSFVLDSLQTICLPSDPKQLIFNSSVNISWYQNSGGLFTWALANSGRFFWFPAEMNGFLRATRTCRWDLRRTWRTISVETGRLLSLPLHLFSSYYVLCGLQVVHHFPIGSIFFPCQLCSSRCPRIAKWWWYAVQWNGIVRRPISRKDFPLQHK